MLEPEERPFFTVQIGEGSRYAFPDFWVDLDLGGVEPLGMRVPSDGLIEG
jgi:hypothetical protein